MRILSGIQPSGTIHIGNYFGMIKKMVESQNDGELFAFLASYHALTTVKEKELLEKNIFEAAVNFLALGMDPEKSTFWVQHDVKEVLELYWILSNHTSMGLLERAHSYKDKVAKGINANHGLFSYPVLMAADILIFDSNIVPVGKDQIQHVEMTRDIANSFNHHYNTDILVMPEAKVDEVVATVPGTDGAKMSKSYGNTIDMFGTKKGVKKQVMSIVTDSKELDEPKEWENCNIYKLCELFMNDEELKDLQQRYATPGEGYGHFKLTLLDKINEHFAPYQERREHLINNPKEVKEILEFGASKARKIASAKMEKIRSIVGL
ncbi:MAG: tryptophan--tRNA ligase [Campylobacteraceae bacterium]|uniref:Tryptophan--tRNA ligase n=1 Tax=Halarcobacter mediterraneus TaxID=2023153 RepID=A0A4Q1AY49_9BACT|nr:tryptophan--tRNA ligase [Halarcobacter mediterraneus]NVJ54531.1 tryptophan--tRNA ligase [Campylobacteraceae bacterium]RXK13290.1 tryptophan--tRNA ligase [Halarcobacter mediterraneus]